ncbi:MAG: PEGA domain-containing protein, partial [Planctomycetes bacterium]|nr:PEGA domain-containing protein [Planctomycetota bacterium]
MQKQKLALLLGTTVILSLCVVGGLLFLKKPNGSKPVGESSPADQAVGNDPQAKPADLAIKPLDGRIQADLFNCQVITTPPGFWVLVDGELARDEHGQFLKTPCEIGIPKGNHTLTIVQEKYRDHSEPIVVTEPQTFELSGVYQPFADPVGFFAARWGTLSVGDPLELESINQGGPAWDPWVSRDGLALWFAGQQSDGKGIYVSRRKTPYEDFGTPELVVRHSEKPASPSVTADQLIVAYALPTKGQVRSLIRNDIGLPFKSGPILRTTEQDDEVWPTAQILPNGKTLYYSLLRNDKLSARLIQRKSLRKPFDGTADSVRIPGGHPRLSADGLRQFWIEGKQLVRARRPDLTAPFSEPEPIIDLAIEGFTRRAGTRQFWVTDDEQWLYYCDDPQGSQKLFAVRVSAGPRWGYAPRGRPLETPATTDSQTPVPGLELPTAEEPAAPEDVVAAPQIDPRSVPLAYAKFHETLTERLAAGDCEGAKQLLATSQTEPGLTAAKTQLEWDQEEVARLAAFYGRLAEIFQKMSPGALIKSGATQVEFESFAEGIVIGKLRGGNKPFRKSLAEFAPIDLVNIFDKQVDRQDAAAQLEVATFLLLHSGKVSSQAIQLRVDRAGEPGKTLLERRSARRLFLIEQEIDRNNIGQAIVRIEKLIEAAPKSQSAQKAREISKSLVTRMTWNKVGNQNWESPAPGEFTTTGKKTSGALLVAPDEYRNFALDLEWKTSDETSQGGVFFRYP